MMFSVPTRVHNNTGYWGPVDAIHQFCEPHYNTSHYIAEFWNATTSIVFPLVACHAYFQIRLLPNVGWTKAACAWLCLIGVGSFMYHATMRRSMQLLDEAPMICFMATCVMGKLQYQSWSKDNLTFYRGIVAAGAGVLIYIYAVLEQYEIFIKGFSLLFGLEFLAGFGWMNVVDETWLAVSTGVLIIIGRIVWEAEQQMCETHPDVWILHIIWHLSAAAGAHQWLLFNAFLMDKLDNGGKKLKCV